LGTLITVEGRPACGESDRLIVRKAWDFSEINRRYRLHLKVLGQLPNRPAKEERSAQALQRWARTERVAWLDAVQADPLLPAKLLPRGYLGKQAWAKRKRVLSRAAALVR
jgi:DNA-binding transcriptional regulator PaaX